MSKDDNIITNILKHYEDENKVARSEFGKETYEYQVKQRIGFEEMHQFIESALKLCFNAETGEYLPEYQNFSINACLIIYYTDLEIPSVDKLYDALIVTDIVETVTSIVNQTQLSQLTFGLNTRIEQILEQRKINESSLGRTCGAIDNLVETGNMLLGTVLDGVENIVDKIANEPVENLIKSLSQFGMPSGQISSNIREHIITPKPTKKRK